MWLSPILGNTGSIVWSDSGAILTFYSRHVMLVWPIMIANFKLWYNKLKLNFKTTLHSWKSLLCERAYLSFICDYTIWSFKSKRQYLWDSQPHCEVPLHRQHSIYYLPLQAPSLAPTAARSAASAKFGFLPPVVPLGFAWISVQDCTVDKGRHRRVSTFPSCQIFRRILVLHPTSTVWFAAERSALRWRHTS